MDEDDELAPDRWTLVQTFHQHVPGQGADANRLMFVLRDLCGESRRLFCKDRIYVFRPRCTGDQQTPPAGELTD